MMIIWTNPEFSHSDRFSQTATHSTVHTVCTKQLPAKQESLINNIMVQNRVTRSSWLCVRNEVKLSLLACYCHSSFTHYLQNFQFPALFVLFFLVLYEHSFKWLLSHVRPDNEVGALKQVRNKYWRFWRWILLILNQICI